MKKTLLSLAALGFVITPAIAMSAGAMDADANGDGMLSIDELQAVHPDITAENFSAMDANADGALDADEVKAAEEAGLLEASSDG
jgi:hypothetical protein